MSWNRVYCILPLPTIVHHKFWLLRKLDDHVGLRLTELARQGWSTRDLVWADWAAAKLPGSGLRRVGDGRSLKIDLIPALSHTGLSPDYVLELAEFSVNETVYVRRPGGRSILRELSIGVEKLVSPSLLHRYTTGSGSDWQDFATERLKRWTEIEACKEQSQRGSASDPSVLKLRDFADDQMPVWYEEYCSQNQSSK